MSNGAILKSEAPQWSCPNPYSNQSRSSPNLYGNQSQSMRRIRSHDSRPKSVRLMSHTSSPSVNSQTEKQFQIQKHIQKTQITCICVHLKAHELLIALCLKREQAGT